MIPFDLQNKREITKEKLYNTKLIIPIITLASAVVVALLVIRNKKKKPNEPIKAVKIEPEKINECGKYVPINSRKKPTKKEVETPKD